VAMSPRCSANRKSDEKREREPGVRRTRKVTVTDLQGGNHFVGVQRYHTIIVICCGDHDSWQHVRLKTASPTDSVTLCERKRGLRHTHTETTN
jgi:hypothetical protein